jgi:hypothetical protein
MEAVVSDFGFARAVEEDSGKTNSIVGPLRWMSPVNLHLSLFFLTNSIGKSFIPNIFQTV